MAARKIARASANKQRSKAKATRVADVVRRPAVTSQQVREIIEAGDGVVRLAPTWVPRSFLMPGKRLKLHPNDYYALGAHRGGIDERWFASTTPAANEGAPWHEGLSYIVYQGR
ncbi:MAG: hypothetical protein RMJ19_11950, partial [Gemmatales bacterium]|nr:hypothetical protein [Gemmatales bacterium]MDW8176378.1 hypothetical protein [Gemmatales bacterium]